LAHRIRNDLTWGEEPFELAKACDCLAALGLSCGTLIEMIATKWLKKPPVFAVASFMSQILVEVFSEIEVSIFDKLEELETVLAVDPASRLNVTLAVRLKRSGFYVYSGAQRIQG